MASSRFSVKFSDYYINAEVLKSKRRLIFNLTSIGALMVFSTISGVNAPLPSAETAKAVETQFTQNLPVEELKNDSEPEKEINTETYVRNYFSDIPLLAEIARCESQFRQFDKNGKVLRGIAVSSDVGVMQINEYYHSDTLDKFGYNIYTLEGNLAYARNLYEREGSVPWKSSSKCWSKANTQLAKN